MLVSELKNKSEAELLKMIEDLKAELFSLRFKNSTGQLDQPHKIKSIKRDIAKVFTVINNKKQAATKGGK